MVVSSFFLKLKGLLFEFYVVIEEFVVSFYLLSVNRIMKGI